MRGLIEIAKGLRAPGARILLAFGSAGDRTNAILHRLAYTAARGPDRVAIAHLDRYLRGRDPQDLADRLQAGLEDGGKPQAPVFQNEIEALEWMFDESAPNDVIAITALAQRPDVFQYLRDRGGAPVGPPRVRELVQRGRS
jgi:cyanophycin synthetase